MLRPQIIRQASAPAVDGRHFAGDEPLWCGNSGKLSGKARLATPLGRCKIVPHYLQSQRSRHSLPVPSTAVPRGFHSSVVLGSGIAS
jgi:hypothetical protein